MSNVDTSIEALQSIQPTASAMRAKIVEMLEAEALTCDEIEVKTGWKHQTVSARLWELERDGEIEQTDETRETRSGRKAHIYDILVAF